MTFSSARVVIHKNASSAPAPTVRGDIALCTAAMAERHREREPGEFDRNVIDDPASVTCRTCLAMMKRGRTIKIEARYGEWYDEVKIDGVALSPKRSQKLINHSPDGFAWGGYEGSGPAQLALALLADHLGHDRRAMLLYQTFKWKVVAQLDAHGWTLTSADIEAGIAAVVDEEPHLAEDELEGGDSEP